MHLVPLMGRGEAFVCLAVIHRCIGWPQDLLHAMWTPVIGSGHVLILALRLALYCRPCLSCMQITERLEGIMTLLGVGIPVLIWISMLWLFNCSTSALIVEYRHVLAADGSV